MLSLEDQAMMDDFAQIEAAEPSPRKMIDESRTIYKSRRFRPPISGKGHGLPILCDLSESRSYSGQDVNPFIQPHIYRAPEITFEMTWSSAIDIWNVAGLVSNSALI